MTDISQLVQQGTQFAESKKKQYKVLTYIGLGVGAYAIYLVAIRIVNRQKNKS